MIRVLRVDLPRGNRLELSLRFKLTREEFRRALSLIQAAEVALLQDGAESPGGGPKVPLTERPGQPQRGEKNFPIEMLFSGQRLGEQPQGETVTLEQPPVKEAGRFRVEIPGKPDWVEAELVGVCGPILQIRATEGNLRAAVKIHHVHPEDRDRVQAVVEMDPKSKDALNFNPMIPEPTLGIEATGGK
jgi:hypothetical protein